MKNEIGSKFIREICIAGPVIDVTLKYSKRSARKKRDPNRNPSREAVIKNNDRQAVKKLTRLMNANFYPGDIHLTLTYEGDPPTVEAAKKECANFKRRLKREYEKRDKEFRWIEVTEYKNHRIHHHMLIPYIETEVITKHWKRGHIWASTLDRSRNYKNLAEYFVKETTKTMRTPGSETKQRWSASRNLVRPVIKREMIEPRAMYQSPKALKGYEIIQESVHTYTHPFTGIDHLEYMMIATDPVPRLKTWRKGTVVKRDETYRRAQEIQICWDSFIGEDFV